MKVNFLYIFILFFLSSIQLLPAQNRLYWTNPTQGIMSSNLDGSNIDTILRTTYYGVGFFDIDKVNEEIFWQDGVKTQFGSSNINSGNTKILLNYGTESLADFQYSEFDQKLYYSDRTNDLLIRMNKDGTSREVIKNLNEDVVINRFDFSRNIHFEYEDGHLMKSLITNPNLNRDTIFSFNSIERLSRFIVDEVNQNLFILTVEYSSEFNNTIYRLYRVDYDGIAPNLIYTDNSTLVRFGRFRYDIDPVDNRVYLFQKNSELYAINYDGTGAKRLASLPDNNTELKIFRYTASTIGFYVGNNDNINRFIFDLSNINSPIKISEKQVFNEPIIKPTGVAFDEKEKKIYWTDDGLSNISRANVDGSEIEVLIDDAITPNGIALDLDVGKMFWTDRGDNSAIYEANLDGSQKRLILNENSRSNVLHPEGIALDTVNKIIYFTSQGTPSIYRTNYEGTSFERVVITNSLTRNIALDLTNNFVYWAEASSFSNTVNGIYRIRIGQGDRELVYQSPSPTIRGGIALDLLNEQIYWMSGQRLQKINSDGNNLQSLTLGTEETFNNGYLTLGATHAYFRGMPRSLMTNDKDTNGDGVLDITDPCACDDSQNIEDLDITYFHDVLTVCGVAPKQNIYLKNNTNDLFLDKNLNPVSLGANLGSPNASGCVVYDFWHISGKQANITVQSSAGSSANFLSAICLGETCEVKKIIPTMSSWGILIFGLLILNMALLILYKTYIV